MWATRKTVEQKSGVIWRILELRSKIEIYNLELVNSEAEAKTVYFRDNPNILSKKFVGEFQSMAKLLRRRPQKMFLKLTSIMRVC